MLYIYSIIFGIVQGITEFLPVSSSGHLVILHNILNFNFEQNLAFDVALHLGTGFALIIYFWQDLKKYFIVFFKFIFKEKVEKAEIDLVFKLIVATMPAVIIGIFLENIIDNALRSVWIVISMLIAISIVFFVVEKYSKRNKQIQELSWGQAILIGFSQALALVPGVSRSGITISAGMVSKLKRAESARFAFLLGIPIILGAGFYKIFKLDFTEFDSELTWIFYIGFISSFITGYLVIRFLMRFLTKHKLNIFAWYRIGLAVILIIYFVVR